MIRVKYTTSYYQIHITHLQLKLDYYHYSIGHKPGRKEEIANENVICPMSRFCNTSSVPTIQNQHHFRCPTYVLKKELQHHKKIRKWSDRTRIGINLGYSSRHALSVSLILNLQTGLGSPQYHCQYDKW